MKLVYLAGPYRADTAWEIEQNVQWAERLAAQLWKHGFVAVSPHLLTRHFQGIAPDSIFLDGLIELMRRCDCVLVFGRSPGTDEEVIEASKCELPVYWSLTQLIRNL